MRGRVPQATDQMKRAPQGFDDDDDGDVGNIDENLDARGRPGPMNNRPSQQTNGGKQGPGTQGMALD
jgi:hypothetical protein